MQIVMGTAHRIALWVKKTDTEVETSAERLAALIAIRLNNYGVVALVTLIGFISGRPLETIIGTAAFVLLRIMTGGMHLRSLDACFVVSTTLLSILPHITISLSSVLLLNLISIVLVLLRSENMKLLPVALIALNFILLSPAASLAFLVQSLTLINSRR